MNRIIILLVALPALAGCLSADGEPEGLADGPMPEGGDADHPHADINQTGYGGFDGEPDDCQRIENPGPFDTSLSTVTGTTETRVLDLVLATDQTFRDLYGNDWEQVARDVAAAADAIYTEQLDLRVNVTAVVAIPADNLTIEPSPPGGVANAEEAFAQSQKVIDDTRVYFDAHFQDLHRDIVYTLVGNETAGPVAGQVDCIGGAKFKDVSYGWGEGRNLEGPIAEFGPVGLGDATGLKVILHEMAHLLGAHHHYQTCGPHLAQSGPGDAFGACSMMTNAVDFASFYFSEVNKIAIRGYAEEVDL